MKPKISPEAEKCFLILNYLAYQKSVENGLNVDCLSDKYNKSDRTKIINRRELNYRNKALMICRLETGT